MEVIQPQNIHLINETRYKSLRQMMTSSPDELGLALEILKNADRRDSTTNFYIDILAKMYFKIPGQHNSYYDEKALENKILWHLKHP